MKEEMKRIRLEEKIRNRFMEKGPSMMKVWDYKTPAAKELYIRLGAPYKRKKLLNEEDIQNYRELIGFDENTEHMKKVIDWCSDFTLHCKDVRENNSYYFKHVCEREIGEYVRNRECALGFYLCGRKVYVILDPMYADGVTYKVMRGFA